MPNNNPRGENQHTKREGEKKSSGASSDTAGRSGSSASAAANKGSDKKAGSNKSSGKSGIR